MTANVVSGIGVTVLLLAFVLNTAAVLNAKSMVYNALNFVGGATAAVGALLIPFFPFVVLEGVWAAVAAIGMIRVLSNRQPRPNDI